MDNDLTDPSEIPKHPFKISGAPFKTLKKKKNPSEFHAAINFHLKHTCKIRTDFHLSEKKF